DVDDIRPLRPQQLPLPARLVGDWDSRSDDGTLTSFEFRADGSMTLVPLPTPVASGPQFMKWYLLREEGDELEVELGPDFNFPKNHRITLTLTCPDAFTVTRTIHSGRALIYRT